ncbi:polysaccharide pyruvyl transferase family protein [Roseobacter sp.]|uniref:polysaccharide pyruvyl transferase family protein n=1 Tax=Roseobacter sp. TaxID=1907202 RepID=UPI00385982ED
MKVGLFTYHFSDNYGALYQAYALRKWFQDQNVTADFINYHPTYVEEGGPLDRPWNPALWRKNATILYMKQSHLARRWFGDHSQKASFDAFRRDQLGVNGARRLSATELQKDVADCKLLVCGSDQIWNPSIQRGLDPVYFLSIAGTDHARKVAYAPSFGRASIEAKYHSQLAHMLGELDAIAVREDSGLDIIQTACGGANGALVVPDPTILLGQFDALLADTLTRDDSTFCYALRTDETIRDVAETVQSELGGPLISSRNSRQRWRDIGEGAAPGPVEWLQMLARSKMVISNSFHGIALSIVLNRPFIAVALPGKRGSLNTRAQNLLKLSGLEDRMVLSSDAGQVRRLAATPIDWEPVNTRLAAVRQTGAEFLQKQLAACSLEAGKPPASRRTCA